MGSSCLKHRVFDQKIGVIQPGEGFLRRNRILTVNATVPPFVVTQMTNVSIALNEFIKSCFNDNPVQCAEVLIEVACGREDIVS